MCLLTQELASLLPATDAENVLLSKCEDRLDQIATETAEPCSYPMPARGSGALSKSRGRRTGAGLVPVESMPCFAFPPTATTHAKMPTRTAAAKTPTNIQFSRCAPLFLDVAAPEREGRGVSKNVAVVNVLVVVVGSMLVVVGNVVDVDVGHGPRPTVPHNHT